jgi:hypothetical protein
VALAAVCPRSLSVPLYKRLAAGRKVAHGHFIPSIRICWIDPQAMALFRRIAARFQRAIDRKSKFPGRCPGLSSTAPSVRRKPAPATTALEKELRSFSPRCEKGRIPPQLSIVLLPCHALTARKVLANDYWFWFAARRLVVVNDCLFWLTARRAQAGQPRATPWEVYTNSCMGTL